MNQTPPPSVEKGYALSHDGGEVSYWMAARRSRRPGLIHACERAQHDDGERAAGVNLALRALADPASTPDAALQRRDALQPLLGGGDHLAGRRLQPVAALDRLGERLRRRVQRVDQRLVAGLGLAALLDALHGGTEHRGERRAVQLGPAFG